VAALLRMGFDHQGDGSVAFTEYWNTIEPRVYDDDTAALAIAVVPPGELPKVTFGTLLYPIPVPGVIVTLVTTPPVRFAVPVAVVPPVGAGSKMTEGAEVYPEPPLVMVTPVTVMLGNEPTVTAVPAATCGGGPTQMFGAAV